VRGNRSRMLSGIEMHGGTRRTRHLRAEQVPLFSLRQRAAILLSAAGFWSALFCPKLPDASSMRVASQVLAFRLAGQSLDKVVWPIASPQVRRPDISADAIERATPCSATAIERRFDLRIQEDEMNMPSFTAEASLYKTNEHYRAVPYNPSAQTVSPVWPAAEVIDIHDCAPGFVKLGEGPNTICIPNPLLTGGDGDGEGPPGNGGPTAGGNGGPKPHFCEPSDLGSTAALGDAVFACQKDRGKAAYLWCVPRGSGRTTAHCCVKNASSGRTSCVPLSSLSGTKAVSHGSAL
jgi:hypothetical protein